MSAPQTPYEETGEWTPLATELAFLTALDGVGGMSVTEIGRSVQGRPILACMVGTGSTVLIGSLQHGNEPATRESSMALLRDLAYRTEPWMDDYLTSHRVVVVPTINPDGRAANTRNNANGENLNRDWVRLTQPESRAVQALINATDPDIVMDAHETTGSPENHWRPYPGGYPGEAPGVRALARDFVDATEAAFAQQGWATLWYNLAFLPFAGMSTVASAHGRVGILSETTLQITPPSLRVEISGETYRHLLRWHQSHRDEIVSARVDAITWQEQRLLRTELPWREYIGSAATPTTTAATYLLDSAIPRGLDVLHGITITDGVAEVRQPSRLMVGALLDAQSVEQVADATPSYEPAEIVARDTGGGMIEQGGLRYPVQQVITQQDGLRYTVQQVITQRGGLRYRA